MSTYFASLGRYAAAAAAAAALSFGCTQTEIDDMAVPESGAEHEVAFEFVCDGYAGTAQTRIPSRDGFEFEDGAVIHVLAEFTKKDGFGPTVGAYECFTYNAQSATWSALGSSDDKPEEARMIWPLNTKSGRFTAFYVPAQANILAFDGENTTVSTVMQSLNAIGSKDGNNHVIGDPLQAEIDGVGYDGKVRLVFTHACTRLVLSDIRGASDTAYNLVRDAKSEGGEQLANGYRLQIERTPVDGVAGTYTYSGKFLWGKVDDEQLELTGGVKKYYVSSPLSTDEGADRNDPKNNYLCFYLAPGAYYGSVVTYRNNDIYLTLNVDGLGGEADKAPKEEQGLKANTSYTIDIRMADGVVNNELVETPDEWAPADETPVKVDVKKFMDALHNGTEYMLDDGTQILAFAGGGLQLMCNVNLQNVNLYHLYKNEYGTNNQFRRSQRNLNGLSHAIVNVNGTLFYELNNRVSNLAIRNAQITFPQKVDPKTHIPTTDGSGEEVTSSELVNHYDYTAGLFTKITGSLENVLIEGIKVSIDLTDVETGLESGKKLDNTVAFPIGAVCGMLNGADGITGLHLRGAATGAADDAARDITVAVKGGNLYLPMFHIGGLIGYQQFGTLQSVDRYLGGTEEYEVPNISVTAEVGSSKAGEIATDVLGQLEIGGIVGYTIYKCSDISLASCPITVDCSNSLANLCHAGGFAGWAQGIYKSDVPNSGPIENVSVRATVKGGMCTIARTSNSELNYYGATYTGGLAGYVQSRQITDCTVSGSVTAGKRNTTMEDRERVATGGIIGCIADRVMDGTFEHATSPVKKSHVFDCTTYVALEGVDDISQTRYYAGRCIGMQNFPNKEVYTELDNKCFVPAPSRRDLATYKNETEKYVFYDQSKTGGLEALGQLEFILDLGSGPDVQGDVNKQGWNPFNAEVGNINYIASGENEQLPFCGAYMDEKMNDQDSGDVWTETGGN